MFHRCVFVIVAFTLLMGCTAGIHDIWKVQYVNEEFGADSLKRGGIAVLPVVAGKGQEVYWRPFAEALNVAIQSFRPELKFLNPEETMSVLNGRGLAETYQSAILTYRETAIIDRGLLREIGEALGVRYVLFVSLEEFHEVSEINFSGYWGWTTYVSRVNAFAQIWDCPTGDVVWEGLGTTRWMGGNRTYEKEYKKYCRIAAEGLAGKLP